MSGFYWVESHLIFFASYCARPGNRVLGDTGLPALMVSASLGRDYQMLCQGVSGVYEETVTPGDVIFISGSHILQRILGDEVSTWPV